MRLGFVCVIALALSLAGGCSHDANLAELERLRAENRDLRENQVKLQNAIEALQQQRSSQESAHGADRER